VKRERIKDAHCDNESGGEYNCAHEKQSSVVCLEKYKRHLRRSSDCPDCGQLIISATIQTDPLPGLDPEQSVNYVPYSFQTKGRDIMVRAVAEEALALTSITLFLAMVAVWAQVLGVV
jgi:hypothetical protein